MGVAVVATWPSARTRTRFAQYLTSEICQHLSPLGSVVATDLWPATINGRVPRHCVRTFSLMRQTQMPMADASALDGP